MYLIFTAHSSLHPPQNACGPHCACRQAHTYCPLPMSTSTYLPGLVGVECGGENRRFASPLSRDVCVCVISPSLSQTGLLFFSFFSPHHSACAVRRFLPHLSTLVRARAHLSPRNILSLPPLQLTRARGPRPLQYPVHSPQRNTPPSLSRKCTSHQKVFPPLLPPLDARGEGRGCAPDHLVPLQMSA